MLPLVYSPGYRAWSRSADPARPRRPRAPDTGLQSLVDGSAYVELLPVMGEVERAALQNGEQVRGGGSERCRCAKMIVDVDVICFSCANQGRGVGRRGRPEPDGGGSEERLNRVASDGDVSFQAERCWSPAEGWSSHDVEFVAVRVTEAEEPVHAGAEPEL